MLRLYLKLQLNKGCIDGPYKYEQIQYKYLQIDNGRREVDGPTQLIFVLVFYLSTFIHVEKDELVGELNAWMAKSRNWWRHHF